MRGGSKTLAGRFPKESQAWPFQGQEKERNTPCRTQNRKGDSIGLKGGDSHPDHVTVILSKLGHERGGKQSGAQSKEQTGDGGPEKGEPDSLPQPVKAAGSVAIAGEGWSPFKNPNTIRLPMDMIFVTTPIAARAESPYPLPFR